MHILNRLQYESASLITRRSNFRTHVYVFIYVYDIAVRFPLTPFIGISIPSADKTSNEVCMSVRDAVGPTKTHESLECTAAAAGDL